MSSIAPDTTAPGPASEAATLVPSRRDGVMVLAPEGVLTPELASRIRRLARSEVDLMVLDHSGCRAEDPAVLDALGPRQWGRTSDEACIVCSPADGRHLLDRTGVARRLTVFHRVEDALQALAFSDAGYGPGWGAHDR